MIESTFNAGSYSAISFDLYRVIWLWQAFEKWPLRKSGFRLRSSGDVITCARKIIFAFIKSKHSELSGNWKLSILENEKIFLQKIAQL